MSDSVQKRWLAQLTSVAPVDKPQAESALLACYRAAGLTPPSTFIWCASPAEATWAVALLLHPTHYVWGPLIESARQSSAERAVIDRIELTLAERFSVKTPAEVRAAAGPPLLSILQFPQTGRGFQMGLLDARMGLYAGDVGPLFSMPGETDPLFAAEQNLYASASAVLASAIACPTTGGLVASTVFGEYARWQMAADEVRTQHPEPSPLLSAMWAAAEATGLWWPFEHAVVVLDRPAELHLNPEHRVHRADGPAIVYRDGAQVYAWNGKTVPGDWIEHPEMIPAGRLRGFDPTFKKHVDGAAGRARRKTVAPPGVRHLYERYAAGEHEAVWRELVSLGPEVRQDPHAADALAVAGETMRRVEQNVKTLIARLREAGYQFQERHPHKPPDTRTAKTIRQLEKAAGALPLSLRVFYEVVGSVDFSGRHRRIGAGSYAPDPLVVYGADDALAEVEGTDADEGERVITVAPDDLHKAGLSGGDPYEIAVPDLSADAVVLNDRHKLLLVDYLRLAFRYGGFPGYEGVTADGQPAELQALADGLLPF